MGKYGTPSYGNILVVLVDIVNELAEANRLKRLEIHIDHRGDYKANELEDQA